MRAWRSCSFRAPKTVDRDQAAWPVGLERADAIAAGALGFVERDVGLFEHLLDAACLIMSAPTPTLMRHRDGRSAARQRQMSVRGDQLPESFAGGERALGDSLREQQRQTPRRRSGRQISDVRLCFCKTSGHRLDDFVAGLVAEGVVDRLEKVDVHHQYCQRPPVALEPRPFDLGKDQKMPAIVQAGQAVEAGEALERGRVIRQFADVAVGSEDVRRGAASCNGTE